MRAPASSLLLALGLAAGAALAGCDQSPADRRGAEDHVFKDQVETIDKAREVETMLRQKADRQQQ